MLVLSRKQGEAIKIDNKITVKVCKIEGNRIVLGIEAPKSVHIVRGELPPRDRNRICDDTN